jgi:uncharacterized protein (TIGR02466 family)
MLIKPIFPQAVLGLSKLEVDHNKVLKHIENIEFIDTEESIKEKANVYISKNLNILDKIDYLRNEIYISVKNYLNNVMKLKIDFQFTTSWVTKTPPNGHSNGHIHQNSFLSGVYYPISDKNFKIKFYKEKSLWGVETIEINDLNADWYIVNLAENSALILFPSNLMHSIEKNLSDKVRYSIAFNTLPLGEIGFGDSKINFK